MKYTDYTKEEWLYNDHLKVVVLGGTGGVGKKVVDLMSPIHEVLSLGSKDIDVRDQEAVNRVLYLADPEVLICLFGKNSNSMLHKIDPEETYQQINTNILGNINVVNAALKIMREKKFGRIILASSVLSNKTILGTSIYSGCKSFIETLARVAGAENAKYGITVNCLRMGYMDAGLTYEIPEDFREKIKLTIPSKEFGDCGNIVNVVEMLIDSDYINGTSIDINGGLNGI